MCTVSMIMDHYRDKWTPLVPGWQGTQPYTPMPTAPTITLQPLQPAISAAEIEEFRQLLARAREYDKRNNEPDCEMDEKRQAILTIAKSLGVEISFI